MKIFICTVFYFIKYLSIVNKNIDQRNKSIHLILNYINNVNKRVSFLTVIAKTFIIYNKLSVSDLSDATLTLNYL